MRTDRQVVAATWLGMLVPTPAVLARTLLTCYAHSAALHLATISLSTLLPLHVVEVGGTKTQVGLLFSVMTGVSMVVRPSVGGWIGADPCAPPLESARPTGLRRPDPDHDGAERGLRFCAPRRHRERKKRAPHVVLRPLLELAHRVPGTLARALGSCRSRPRARARHRGVRARPLSPRAATDSDVAPHERGALGERRIRHVSDPAGSRRGPDTRARTGPRHGDRVGGMGFWDRGRCGPSRFHHRSLVLPSRLCRGRNSGNHGPDDVSRHGAPGT